MGNINRKEVTGLSPGNANDITKVTSELDHIRTDGVNDNYDRKLVDTYDGLHPDGARANLSVVGNANEIDLNAVDIATNAASIVDTDDAAVLLDARVVDLENAGLPTKYTYSSGYTVASTTETAFAILMAADGVSTCTVPDPVAASIEIGRSFTIMAVVTTASDAAARCLNIGVVKTSVGSQTYKIHHGEFLTATLLDDGGTGTWGVQVGGKYNRNHGALSIPANINTSAEAQGYLPWEIGYISFPSGSTVTSIDFVLWSTNVIGMCGPITLEVTGSDDIVVKRHADDGGATYNTLDSTTGEKITIIPDPVNNTWVTVIRTP